MSLERALEALQTSRAGLTMAEAQRRFLVHGANVLAESRRRTPLGMFCSQFTDFMILVLLGAAALSALISDVKDTVAIVAIVALNAVVGFVQEYRADRALERR
jgi:P-type Ca2+ transporter type 2C